MNDTAANSLGVRSFFFTLKMEKCNTRSELAAMLVEYTKAITIGSEPEEAQVLTERVRNMLR